MDVFERAVTWMTHDPDLATRAELGLLIEKAKTGDAKAKADLAERFTGPLEFGTAGLRGVLGAGESRMNRAVVRRTTWGLGEYLLANDSDAKKKGVAIGYDGRHMSRELAEDTASVLAALGIVAHLSPTVCPTPVTAYAVTRLGAAAGVMVTASHNPPEYNGYKVYWGNGAQIIPPHDKGIARSIESCGPADEVALLTIAEARAKGLLKSFPADLESSYLDKVQALSVEKGMSARDGRIVYTALHGVGSRLAGITLARAGFSNVHSVPEQAEPNGDFPTVAFPNPEEKGALDLSYALAEKEGADLIIANDPDVDRLSIAERRKPQVEGQSTFVQLTGNQVGVLLGHYLLTTGAQPDNRCVLASCVSSPMLGHIAERLGVHYEETLTGFKWIANRAMDLEAERDVSFVFGYEEALGYTVGSLVRDKDGISAALLMAELWASRRKNGKTLQDELESIYRKYGLYVSSQVSITMKGQDGLEQIRAVMKKLRGSPPKTIGQTGVTFFSDISTGIRRDAGGTEKKLPLPPSDVLIFELEKQHRIIARPSGTEPKIKFYFDVREPIAEGETLMAAEARANATMKQLQQDFVEIAKA